MINTLPDKVGIVIVSYNASTAVRITLASLRQAKNETPNDVLLIDNDSKEMERQIIRSALERHVTDANLPWHYIQLEENLGFAGGNNVGITNFLEDDGISHICLLNSDVIVSDFWLDRLLEKQCKIISAVTNKADSEQCVPIDYDISLSPNILCENESIEPKTFHAVNEFSEIRYKTWYGNVVTADVTFFCVLISKELFLKFGLLDTNFFPGGYEDDDFCARVHAAGIPIHLARDVFIHHWGSASFGQLQTQFFNENAVKNRAYLENKHNFIWKSRPQMPLVSYSQDLTYALKGHGNRSLQQRHHKLSVKTLSRIVSHYEREFTNLRNLLLHSGKNIPQNLDQKILCAESYGSISERWGTIIKEIDAALNFLTCEDAEIKSICRKLDDLANAVYSTATANVAIHEFLKSSTATEEHQQIIPLNVKLRRNFRLMVKGIRVLWIVRGIVFFGGYPYPEREKDGYFQRIRAIDSLFTDRWRIYVDHDPLPGRSGWYDFPAANTLVLTVRGTNKLQHLIRLIVIICVLRCRAIYFHSVLRMEDGKFGNLLRVPGILKIIDIHGVVPEEFRYHNDFFSACLCDKHEALAVSKCDYVIVVSENMHRYLQQKYREKLRGKVIIFPIFPRITPYREDKSYTDGRPVVVYAGGLHKWQQVPKMIDAMTRTAGICSYRFYCPDSDAMVSLLPEKLRRNPSVIVESKRYEDLLKIYPECHFGLILREDIVVNQAACPTKLVEYLAMGIVPIVDCENIGDFKALGMQYIRLRDFLRGSFPDEETRNLIAKHNFEIYTKLQELHRTGAITLQHALERNTQSFIQRLRQYVPRIRQAIGSSLERSSGGRVVLKVWQHAMIASRKPNLAPPQKTMPSHLPLCDVLVQVDNFLSGGLENVALDLNHALIDSGLRVALLILGEAGAAAERAKDMGIPVCVTKFDPRDYKSLLNAASPKVVIAHYSTHGAAICGRLNIPLIQVVHNTYMWLSPDQLQQFSEAAQHTTIFIAVSDFAKAYSVLRMNIPTEKFMVIRNGIDLTRFKQLNLAEERKKVRAEHRFADDDFIFLSVTSINHQKNVLATVKAFCLAFSGKPEVKLVLLGKIYEINLFKEIKDFIATKSLERQVIYAGESEKPHEYYAMADAFVHAAFFEGGPLVLIEALAANLPVVVTETGYAVNFTGHKGVTLVKPPVDIFTYNGSISALRSSREFEENLAAEMHKLYISPVRPEIPEAILETFDKHNSYNFYVKIVKQIID